MICPENIADGFFKNVLFIQAVITDAVITGNDLGQSSMHCKGLYKIGIKKNSSKAFFLLKSILIFFVVADFAGKRKRHALSLS